MAAKMPERRCGEAWEGRAVPMRLQRFLARAGVASRRGSENLMTAGRVRVNGRVSTELGTKVDPSVDSVTVDGIPVVLGTPPACLMLNKPSGVLTTMSDPHGRPTVASLVPRDRYPGLFPVGRLDMDTTGLLLFTTDGDLGQRLLHPSHHVWKTYLALVDGALCDRDLDPLRAGIDLDDGSCLPARCRPLPFREGAPVAGSDAPPASTVVEISIREGRKNQVKRMFGALGHPVLRLHRSRIGGLALGDLPVGAWRELSAFERSSLESASDNEEAS